MWSTMSFYLTLSLHGANAALDNQQGHLKFPVLKQFLSLTAVEMPQSCSFYIKIDIGPD